MSREIVPRRRHPADKWSRVTKVDVYPRDRDPLRPPPAGATPGAPYEGVVDSLTFDSWVRRPIGSRPIVYRRYLSYTLPVGTVATPILPQVAAVEVIKVQVTSVAANPVFFGAQNVDATNGTRVNPGQAIIVEEEQQRYEWETVRAIQELTNVVARGLNVRIPVPPARWPNRVVLNPNDFYLIANVARAVGVFLFYPPEA